MFHCPFHLSFHHSRCDAALSLFASKWLYVSCYAYRLAPCDLGDPGWGDPWFPHGAFVASLAFWCGLVIFGFLPCRDDTMLSSLAWISPRTGTCHTLVLRFCFVLVFFVCFVLVGLFLVGVWFFLGGVLSFCLLCFCNGIVTAAGLCTGPIPVHFCGPQPDGGYMYALIS